MRILVSGADGIYTIPVLAVVAPDTKRTVIDIEAEFVEAVLEEPPQILDPDNKEYEIPQTDRYMRFDELAQAARLTAERMAITAVYRKNDKVYIEVEDPKTGKYYVAEQVG